MLRIRHYWIFTRLPSGLLILGIGLILIAFIGHRPIALIAALGVFASAAIVAVGHRLLLVCPNCESSIYSPILFPKFAWVRQPFAVDNLCINCGFDLTGNGVKVPHS